jgi:hypothetical protein
LIMLVGALPAFAVRELTTHVINLLKVTGPG